jgi:hypothetical protein
MKFDEKLFNMKAGEDGLDAIYLAVDGMKYTELKAYSDSLKESYNNRVLELGMEKYREEIERDEMGVGDVTVALKRDSDYSVEILTYGDVRNYVVARLDLLGEVEERRAELKALKNENKTLKKAYTDMEKEVMGYRPEEEENYYRSLFAEGLKAAIGVQDEKAQMGADYLLRIFKDGGINPADIDSRYIAGSGEVGKQQRLKKIRARKIANILAQEEGQTTLDKQ